MQAITVSDREAGVAGMSLTDLPHPEAASNDVVVRVHAAGFTPGELGRYRAIAGKRVLETLRAARDFYSGL